MTKNPLSSLTIQGLLVMILGVVATSFELPINPELLTQDIITTFGHVAEVVGIVVAAFGRWRATTPLSVKAPLKQ